MLIFEPHFDPFLSFVHVPWAMATFLLFNMVMMFSGSSQNLRHRTQNIRVISVSVCSPTYSQKKNSSTQVVVVVYKKKMFVLLYEDLNKPGIPIFLDENDGIIITKSETRRMTEEEYNDEVNTLCHDIHECGFWQVASRIIPQPYLNNLLVGRG